MWRWWPVLLVLGCGARQPAEPAPEPDPVWRERVEHAFTALTRDSLVPGDPAVVTAAGWRALGEAPDGKLADRVALEPDKGWLVIAAMAAATDDPHTLLVSPDALEQFGGSIAGKPFTAPGATVHWTLDHELVVSEVIAGGPAADAGLAVGDVITAVNGAPPPRSWSLVGAMFVPEASQVTLSSTRGRESREIAFAARAFDYPVSVHRVADDIGILHPYFFPTAEDPTRNALELARVALAEFDRAKVSGVVLDLRGNMGGEGFAPYTSLFTAADPLLVAHPPDPEPAFPWPNAHAAWPTQRPVAVLIDEQSISLAEMVALALQVHAGARVFGQPSGNALNVPDLVDLGDGYMLVLPLVPVSAPDAPPQMRVEPDVEVPNRSVADLRAGRDLQLEAAIHWLETAD
jgi:carboxyl-terminal processing protease